MRHAPTTRSANSIRLYAGTKAALAGWDNDYGQAYSLHVTYNPRPNEPVRVRNDPEVDKQALPGKIAQLTNSIRLSGGTLLERGRWFVEHARNQEALVPLEQFLTRYPESSGVPEARYLVHRARLQAALEQVDVQNTKRDEAAALAQLDVIARDPYDFGVCAAKIAKAAILSALLPGDAPQPAAGAVIFYGRVQIERVRSTFEF